MSELSPIVKVGDHPLLDVFDLRWKLPVLIGTELQNLDITDQMDNIVHIFRKDGVITITPVKKGVIE